MSDNFVDDRAKQENLIKRPERADPETRIDRGSSEEFADDRHDLEESDHGDQSSLFGETVDDGNQRDLTGDVAGESPQWSE
jgi:hypothetical protein